MKGYLTIKQISELDQCIGQPLIGIIFHYWTAGSFKSLDWIQLDFGGKNIFLEAGDLAENITLSSFDKRYLEKKYEIRIISTNVSKISLYNKLINQPFRKYHILDPKGYCHSAIVFELTTDSFEVRALCDNLQIQIMNRN